MRPGTYTLIASLDVGELVNLHGQEADRPLITGSFIGAVVNVTGSGARVHHLEIENDATTGPPCATQATRPRSTGSVPSHAAVRARPSRSAPGIR